jgi:hypothetical protein
MLYLMDLKELKKVWVLLQENSTALLREFQSSGCTNEMLVATILAHESWSSKRKEPSV